MLSFISFFIFIFGTIVGSFLNVVALRYNTGMPIARGRSQCFSCGKTLRWYELVPLFSFMVLRGKCSVCKSKISLQYPIVELITGLLFYAVFLKFGIVLEAFYYFFIIILLVVISVYDLKHKIIPDSLVFMFGSVALASSLFSFFYLHSNTLLDVFAGPILATPFALLWLVSSGRWIGLGDAKLILGIGFMLGLARGVSAVVFAFWIGAFFSIALIVLQRILSLSSKNLTMKSEIPFGPFLIIGTLLAFFFGLDIMHISELLSF
jgi:prepilin signal peptidase PulO-like enzyme (type II secretory pathway)